MDLSTVDVIQPKNQQRTVTSHGKICSKTSIQPGFTAGDPSTVHTLYSIYTITVFSGNILAKTTKEFDFQDLSELVNLKNIPIPSSQTI